LKILGILKNGENLLLGIGRALKSSYVILLLFILINFILSTIAFHLFHEKSPDFENPLAALYSVFKIFTVEGWYEIPEQISMHYGFWGGWFVRLFFIVILFIGGIFGLSIVNAVFVEGMVNNDNTDNKLDEVLERLERIEKNQNPPIDKE
jgi:voltage-gated sodium channel